MDTYVPQSVSNLVWAYATLGVQPGQDFCAAVCAHMGAHLAKYGSQHIANTLWALAVLDYRDEETLRSVAGEVSASVYSLITHSLTFGLKHPGLTEALPHIWVPGLGSKQHTN